MGAFVIFYIAYRIFTSPVKKIDADVTELTSINKYIKPFVCDFVVGDKVIVELKAIKQIGEIEKLQVINYLKASGFEIGLLFNFGGKSLEWNRLINTKTKKSDEINNNHLNQCNQ